MIKSLYKYLNGGTKWWIIECQTSEKLLEFHETEMTGKSV